MEMWIVIDKPKKDLFKERLLIIKMVMDNVLNHTVTTLLGNHQRPLHFAEEIVLNDGFSMTF